MCCNLRLQYPTSLLIRDGTSSSFYSHFCLFFSNQPDARGCTKHRGHLLQVTHRVALYEQCIASVAGAAPASSVNSWSKMRDPELGSTWQQCPPQEKAGLVSLCLVEVGSQRGQVTTYLESAKSLLQIQIGPSEAYVPCIVLSTYKGNACRNCKYFVCWAVCCLLNLRDPLWLASVRRSISIQTDVLNAIVGLIANISSCRLYL